MKPNTTCRQLQDPLISQQSIVETQKHLGALTVMQSSLGQYYEKPEQQLPNKVCPAHQIWVKCCKHCKRCNADRLP